MTLNGWNAAYFKSGKEIQAPDGADREGTQSSRAPTFAVECDNNVITFVRSRQIMRLRRGPRFMVSRAARAV